MLKFLTAITCCLFAAGVQAELQSRPVSYEIGGQKFEGILVYETEATEERPALLMVPNWMGPTPQAVEKAKRVAEKGYNLFIADMYGVEIRPTNPEEASKAASTVREDRKMMRERAQKALEVMKAQRELKTDRIGAIGFCFGGGTVLELARSGAEVAGVVSFHGNLDTPNPADASKIRAKVQVLHGADDPYVPKEQVDAFIKEMQDAGVDWQLMMFGNAVHSFTDPTANVPGQQMYDPLVAQKSFTMMHNFFQDAFQASP